MVTDGASVSYIERNNISVNVNRVTIPFTHCNTFISTQYQDNVYDDYSLQRINVMKSILTNNMSYIKLFDTLRSNNHLWVNEDKWRTIYAFIFDPKDDKIWYCDRKVEYKTYK